LALLVGGGFLISGRANHVNAAGGTTYYVDTTGGSDSNTGQSESEAWQTLAKVNNTTFSPGDTVLLKRGGTFNGTITPNASTAGTAGSPITFSAYGTGADPVINSTAYGIVNLGNGRDYITVKDMTLQGNEASSGYASISISGANYATIQNVIANGASGTRRGLSISGGLVSGLSLKDVDFSNSGYCVYIATNINDTTIDGLTCDNTALTGGIYAYSWDVGNLTIKNSSITRAAGSAFTLASNSVVDTLTIQNTDLSRNIYAGLAIAQTVTANQIVIDNVTASNNGSYGLNFNGTIGKLDTNNTTTNSNKLVGFYVTGVTNPVAINRAISNDNGTIDNVNSSGLVIGNVSAVITNSEASRNKEDGFSVVGNGHVIFDHCVANENGTTGNYLNESSDGDGFTYHDTATGVVRYSSAKNNLKGNIVNAGTGSIDIYYNVLSFDGVAPSRSAISLIGGGNYHINNNTIYNNAQTVEGIYIGVTTNADIQNNIIYGFDSGIVSSTTGTITENYNNIYGFGSTAVSGFTLGANSLTDDPKFVNASSGDFSLQDISPAIDAGMDLGYTVDFAGGNVFNGLAPEMGAFEYEGIDPGAEWLINGNSHTVGNTTNLVFSVDKDYSLLSEVSVDTVAINSPSQYTSASGSTVVTLLADYLNGLSLGEHAIAVTFTDGTVAHGVFHVLAKAPSPITPVNPANPNVPNTGLGLTRESVVMIAGLITMIAVVGVTFVGRKLLKGTK
jgi:hypothetical protein